MRSVTKRITIAASATVEGILDAFEIIRKEQLVPLDAKIIDVDFEEYLRLVDNPPAIAHITLEWPA